MMALLLVLALVAPFLVIGAIVTFLILAIGGR